MSRSSSAVVDPGSPGRVPTPKGGVPTYYFGSTTARIEFSIFRHELIDHLILRLSAISIKKRMRTADNIDHNID